MFDFYLFGFNKIYSDKTETRLPERQIRKRTNITLKIARRMIVRAVFITDIRIRFRQTFAESKANLSRSALRPRR